MMKFTHGANLIKVKHFYSEVNAKMFQTSIKFEVLFLINHLVNSSAKQYLFDMFLTTKCFHCLSAKL